MPDQIIKTKSQHGRNSKEAANHLKEIDIEKKYQDLIANIDEGFCVIEMIYDTDGNVIDYRFVEINSAFERTTGLKKVLGKTINEVAPKHGTHWFEIFGKAVRTGKNIRFESPATNLGRYYDILTYRIGGEGSRLVAILFKSITERKKAEEERKQNEKKYPLLFERTLEKEKALTAVADKMKKNSLLLGILVVLIGTMVLIGWVTDISFLKSFHSDWISMKVNTAICFSLAGFTLIILNRNKPAGRRKFWSSAFSLIILCIATVTLIEYIFNFNAGIDELFFKDPITAVGTASPGRPALPTAISFFLVGIALFLVSIKKISLDFFQGLNLAVGLAALFSLLGYLFEVRHLTDSSLYTAVALPTSVSFLVLVLASLFLFPESGVMKLVSSNTSGGRFIRRFLPLIILTIIISAWLSMEEKWASFYDVYTGMAVYVMIIIIAFTIIIFGNAKSLTRSEKKLIRETEFSNYLLESVPGLFYLIGESGTLLKWNKSFETETGYTSKEIENMKALDFFSTEDQDLISAKLVEAVDKGESGAEANLASNTGQLTPYHFTAKKIVLEGRNLLIGTALDITESRRIAQELQQASLYNRSLIEASLDPLITISPNGIITDVNEATIKVTGVERTKLVDTDFSNYFTEPEKAKQGYQQVMKEGFVTDYPLTILHLNGNCTEVLFNASVYKDAYGNILGVFAAARDITAKKIAEQERELYYKFFNTTRDIMVVADPLGCFKKVNPACLQLLGYNEEELISKPFVDFIYEEDKQRTSDEMAQQMQRGYSLNFENRYTCKNGKLLWLSWRAQYSAEEGITYATARDITEHKLMEDKLKQSETKYRSLFENMIEGYALCQMIYNDKGEPIDFIYVEVNKRFEQLVGLANTKGKKWTELFPRRKEKHPDLPHLYNRVLMTGITEKKETYYDDKDAWYSFTIAPFSKDHFIFVFEDITDKKKAEQTLQQSSLYNRSLIEASPDPLVTISHEGKITDVNEATVEITGVERSKLIGTDFSNYFTEPKKAKEGYQKVLQEGSVTDYPLTIHHVNGKLTEVLYNASVYKDISGKISGVFAAARDVTESRQMEQKLIASEARLKEAQRLAKIGNWELDLKSSELKWSDEIYHIFELDPKVFGATYEAFLNAIHPDDRQYVSNAYETSVATRTSYSIDHRLLMSNGNIKYVHEQCVTFYDRTGTPVRSIGTVQDITERKIMEEKQKSVSIYTRSLIEASLDPLVTISPLGKITDVNEATIKVTGVERSKLIGTDFSDYFTEPGEAKKGYQQVLKEGFVTDYPLTIRNSNGKLTEVLYNASIYKDISGKISGVFAAARDVTAQKKAEAQLHKLNTTLEEKVKERTSQYETVNKELESFTYSVSHDLRAPLRAINSYSQILNEDYSNNLDEDGKQILDNIKYNTAKMGKLIDELLAFSRLGRKQLERAEVDMNVLVKEVLDDLNNTMTHHAKITVGALPVVKADYTLLSQVMHNLISNAIKYSSKKEKPVVEIYTEKKDSKNVFAVKDNGAGFDMRYADKLFGVFQRLHSEKEYEGNGVGLAIVKRIINKHGGEVWGYAEENKGASFYFTLN